jgi:hypothetical protein
MELWVGGQSKEQVRGSWVIEVKEHLGGGHAECPGGPGVSGQGVQQLGAAGIAQVSEPTRGPHSLVAADVRGSGESVEENRASGVADFSHYLCCITPVGVPDTGICGQSVPDIDVDGTAGRQIGECLDALLRDDGVGTDGAQDFKAAGVTKLGQHFGRLHAMEAAARDVRSGAVQEFTAAGVTKFVQSSQGVEALGPLRV